MFLEYGVNDASRYVHISQVTSGRVPLQCPYCGQGLIARKGTQKEHHFAHDGNTCRESQRDFEALNIPYFDRFDTYIDGKTWAQLQAFHEGKSAYLHLLESRELIRYNDFGRNGRGSYELTHLGKIPFGIATLEAFEELQLNAIWKRHYELAETVRLAQYGNPHPHNPKRYLINPAPDMTLPAITDLNIYRSQLARVFSLDLYLLEIDCDIENLYKIGVTSDINRRVSEIQRDLSAYTTVKNINVLRLLARRGAIERYALHRYRDHQTAIGNLTEYFQFDSGTRRNVLSNFTRLGDFELADDSNRYIDHAPNEITNDDSLQRFSTRGLITSILDGQLSQIETLVRPAIKSHVISKGTIEGMQRAKAAGIHVGRPTEDDSLILDKYPQVVNCVKNGVSLRKTASRCGVSINTVRKVKSIMGQ